jgi:23S rRNA (uridine2552-2'-O)-methyltransferase
MPKKPSRTKSSQKWLKEHFTDPYVKQAHQEGYRSRAVYKLLEIHQRDRMFKPGMKVVDLGAAPGGWSQLVIKLIHPNGRLVAMDILPMEPIDKVDFIQGDFTEDAILDQLMERLDNEKVDWVISDMAPNTSGTYSVDVARSVYLSEIALDFAQKVLKKDGGFLIKVFQGEGFDVFLGEIKRIFAKTVIRKPKASRDRSREVYVLARGLR